MATTEPAVEKRVSSRHDERFAGWDCTEQGAFKKLMPSGPQPKFSWLRSTAPISATASPA
jgi:hypothetical protein